MRSWLEFTGESQMRKRNQILLAGVILSIILMAGVPSTMAQPAEKDQADVLLFIYGGFGLHFTIINDRNETIQAHYAIYGEGLYVNKTWEKRGDFTAAPNVWTSAPPTFVPFSVMPITAYLYTDGGDMLERSGISIFGWVFLVM